MLGSGLSVGWAGTRMFAIAILNSRSARPFLARDLLNGLRQTIREVDATLAKFDMDSLVEKKTIQGLEVTALEAILHVVEHFSMHTGQIILLTKILTSSDLRFYEFEGDTPLLRFNVPFVLSFILTEWQIIFPPE
jgi:hypothetical protein